MELRHYFFILRKWLWLVILGAVLGAGSAYVFSKYSTPIYQSTATLLISQGDNASGVSYTDLIAGQNIAATYVEQIKSPVILGQVITDLNLPFTPQQLGSMLTVQQVRNTLLINITIEDANPERAQAIANQIATDFSASNMAIQQARYQAAQSDLDQQVADLRKRIDDTQKALVPLGDPTDPKSTSAPEFVRTQRLSLQMQLDTLQAQYTVLLQSAQNFRLAASRSMDSLTVSTPAQLPRAPIRPQTMMNTLLGLVVGVMLGVGIAFLIEYLDDTVKTSDDVTRVMNLNTLGNVMRFPVGAHSANALVTFAAPRTPYAEAYRNLRTNLQFALLGDSAKTLVVTSAEPGEGKTTTLANAAVALAQAGKRVIVVDTDLRRPTLHKLFNLHQEPGLTDVMMQGLDGLSSVLQETSIPGLRVLPSGTIPPNPAEILSTRWLDGVIDALKQQADMVLFDSPPILPVTDAMLLAAKTGNVLWVIGSGKTRSDALRKAKEALVHTEAKVLGVVLNKLSSRRGGYGYYYYNYYYAKDGRARKRKHEASTAKLSLPPMPAVTQGNGRDHAPAEPAPEKLKG